MSGGSGTEIPPTCSETRGNIARAYADNYDPSQETTRFPGLFADRSNNLLVSSGFAEISLYQDDGTAVHQLSAPVTARFEAKRASWSTLPDLEPNSGRIELPMYSFDQVSGEWVPEANGELQRADGSVVSEDDLAAIRCSRAMRWWAPACTARSSAGCSCRKLR